MRKWVHRLSGNTKRNRAGLVWLGGKVCKYCGFAAERKEDMTIDHIIALSLGGSNDLENLQLLCLPCNQRKNTLEQRVKLEAKRGLWPS